MEAGLDLRPATAETLRREVMQIKVEGQKSLCVLKEGGRLLVSNVLASQIRPGDEIDLPLVFDSQANNSSSCSRPSILPFTTTA